MKKSNDQVIHGDPVMEPITLNECCCECRGPLIKDMETSKTIYTHCGLVNRIEVKIVPEEGPNASLNEYGKIYFKIDYKPRHSAM